MGGMDDTSDILGGPLHLKDTSFLATVFSSNWYILVATVVLGATYMGLCKAWRRIKKWQEATYRKASRRRHGIPDEDNRPFAVAYAAAQRAQNGKPKPPRNLAFQRRVPPSTGTNTPIASHAPGSPWAASPAPQVYTSSYAASPAPYLQHEYRQEPPQFSYPPENLSAPTVPNGLVSPGPSIVPEFIPARKRRAQQEEEEEEENTKKTRVEGEEFIDGDELAGFELPQRGFKREFTDEEEEPSRDKRARKYSRDHTPEDHVMEDEVYSEHQDEDEEMSELHTFVSRGKKRDRAAAGSTFGGDEEGESQHGSSRRKQKRHSESESRKQRHSSLSKDPLCKGRRIGDKWEANGIHYKVGPSGERLRQTLVKQARSKFVMPKDSEHPDSQAHLEVFVEMWLTEEEWKKAKDNYELAWQDAPSESVEPEEDDDVKDFTPVKAGKNLLWAQEAASPLPAAKRGPFRQSVATNLGMRINPFQTDRVPSAPNTAAKPMLQQASRPAGRRIASTRPSLIPPSIPGDGSYRSFSKWEKQDLEAEAMVKMRERMSGSPTKPELTPGASAPAASSFTVPPAPASTPVPETKSFFAPPAVKPAPPLSAAPSVSTPSTISTTPVGLPKPAPVPPSFFAAPKAPETALVVTSAAPSNLFAPAPVAAPLAEAPKPAVPNFFAPKTAEPAVPTAPKSTFNFAGSGSAPKPPAPTSAFTAPTAPKSAFTAPTVPPKSAFAAPTPSAAPGLSFASAAQPATPAKPSAFGFGPSTMAGETKKTEGGSLFARMGPPSTTPASSGFSAPALGGLSAPASGGLSAPASGGFSAPAPVASGSSAFSFGPAKAATPASAPVVEEAKPVPAPAKFSFAPSKPAAANAFGGFSSGSGTGSAFGDKSKGVGFGEGSKPVSAFGGSAFGAEGKASGFGDGKSSVFGDGKPATSASGEAKPSAFGAPASGSAFGGTAPATSAFGAISPSAFGTTSAFGAGAKSAFGGASTPSSTPSAFGFGASASTTPALTDAPKSAFGGGVTFAGAGSSAFGSNNAFGSTPSTTTADPATKKFSFGGASAATTPAFGTTSTPTSAFGAASSGAPTNPFGAPASTSVFGSTPAAPTNGTASTPSTFGFNATKPAEGGAFSFGKK